MRKITVSIFSIGEGSARLIEKRELLERGALHLRLVVRSP